MARHRSSRFGFGAVGMLASHAGWPRHRRCVDYITHLRVSLISPCHGLDLNVPLGALIVGKATAAAKRPPQVRAPRCVWLLNEHLRGATTPTRLNLKGVGGQPLARG